MPNPPTSSSPGPSKILPASLSHFVIFNPTIKPEIPKSDNKDDDDDLKEAAQILFYTSREAGGVSRDKMLRQVGLAKGLMGFGNMLSESKSKYTSIHANRSRMIIYTPEPDFFIYICITLAHTDNEKKDPASGCQGISDEMLVDGLARGYEDFRLLHGPLSSHTLPSASLSTILDKYFTRFAFQFESTHLGSPSLSNWLQGYPSSSIPKEIFEDFSSQTKGSLIVIGPKGPLYKNDKVDDPALIRYLHNSVISTLPPLVIIPISPTPIDRQSLGFGLNLGLGRITHTNSRKGSWTTLGGWVPEIRRTSTPSKPESPSKLSLVEDNPSKGKWGFGLSGIGDAMGNVGTVFGLGRSSTPVQGESQEDKRPVKSTSDIGRSITSNSSEPPPSAEIVSPTSHHVEQTPIAVSELEDAVEPDEEMEWEGKSFWLKTNDKDMYEKRRVCWVIRNNILISIIMPPNTTPPYTSPSTKSTTALFAELTDELSKETHSTSPYPCIMKSGKDKLITRGEMDPLSDHSLVQLKSKLEEDSSIHEILGKTSSSRFLVAKKNDRQELYMTVDSHDPSLTDADHAVRTFVRLNAG